MKKRLYAIFVALIALTTLLTLAVAADDGTDLEKFKVIIDESVSGTIDITVTYAQDGITYHYTMANDHMTYDLIFDEDGEATIQMTGGDILEGEFPAGTVFSPPEGEEYTSAQTVENDVTVYTIKSSKPQIKQINDFSTSGSGDGWSWEGTTLTIEVGYILSDTTIENCKKLVLNGKLEGCYLPEVTEITGSGTIENCIFGAKVNDEAKQLTVNSDAPFELGYGSVSLKSDSNNSLTLYLIGVSQLDVKSGLDDGELTNKSGLELSNNKLTLDPNASEYKLGFTSYDGSWIDNNHTITTVSQLKDFANCVNNGMDFSGKTITLGADIDCSSVEFTPIVTDSNSFKGTFDGKNHTITLGTIASYDNCTSYGLFAVLGEGAVVKNLTVGGDKVIFSKSTDTDVAFGSIAGCVESGATILNCRSDININASLSTGYNSGTFYFGGLVGILDGDVLNSIYAGSESINSSSFKLVTSGIAAVSSFGSSIKNCFTDSIIGNPPNGITSTPETTAASDNNYIKRGLYYYINDNYPDAKTELSDMLQSLNANVRNIDGAAYWTFDNGGNVALTNIVPSLKIADDSPEKNVNITITEDNAKDINYKFDVTGKLCSVKNESWYILSLVENTLTVKSSELIKKGLGKYQVQLYTVLDYDYDTTTFDEAADTAKLTITITVAEPEPEPEPCNHNFVWIIDREPSYTETGLKHEECTKCHEKRNVNTVIDKLEKEDPPIIIMNAYISFETNGGEKLDTVSTIFGTKVDLMKYIPEREGYEFDGWYKDAELTEFVSSIRAVGNTTVYAKWIREELPFKDVDRDSKYYDDIEFVWDEGLMIGTSDDEFSPYQTLTRGMVTTILWRMNRSPVVNYLMLFKDVDEEAYYGEAVRWAASEKIVNGISSDLFAPDAEVTREQLATIIYRCVQKNGGGFKGMWYFPLNYDDAAEISDYANEAMHWCVMNGIIEPDENNNLRPTESATRAETAHAYHILSQIVG